MSIKLAVLNTKRADIYYECFGDSGPWVTLVNGYTRSSSDFRKMSQHLVQMGFRVLVFDNRGCGKSVADSEFSLQDISDDILALWRENRILESALVGISMGGLIAQDLACSNPDRVSALCLISTFSSKQYAPDVEASWGETQSEIVDDLSKYFAGRFFERNQLLVQAMAKQILAAISGGKYLENAQSQRRAIIGYQSDYPEVELISNPTLIVHGREDRVIAFEAAEEIHRRIADAKIVALDGIGHLLLAECPKVLYKCVSDFLREIET